MSSTKYKKPVKADMDEIINNIVTLLKGKTVQEMTNILFKVMDKVKATTIV